MQHSLLAEINWVMLPTPSPGLHLYYVVVSAVVSLSFSLFLYCSFFCSLLPLFLLVVFCPFSFCKIVAIKVTTFEPKLPETTPRCKFVAQSFPFLFPWPSFPFPVPFLLFPAFRDLFLMFFLSRLERATFEGHC